jgi:sigma-B regulation protein RsbU (phosphoserine phosphatase)
MFTTLFLAYYNINSGELLFSNAGHDYPYIISNDKSVKLIKTKQNIALGVDDERIYQTESIILNKNDILVLYTDGILEATNINNELYGNQRFKKVLEENCDLSLEELLSNCVNDIKKFQGETLFDDITLLLFKRRS